MHACPLTVCLRADRCNDQDTRRSHRIGDTWTKTDANGHALQCVCLGNGRGEWKCERHNAARGEYPPDPHQNRPSPVVLVLTSVPLSAGTGGAAVVVAPAQPQPEPPLEGTCRTDSGAVFYDGQRWIRNQGNQQMICTCLGNGVSCEEWGESGTWRTLEHKEEPRRTLENNVMCVTVTVCASVCPPHLSLSSNQKPKTRCTGGTLTDVPVPSHSRSGGGATTRVRLTDDLTDSCGVQQPQTTNASACTPSVPRRTVGGHTLTHTVTQTHTHNVLSVSSSRRGDARRELQRRLVSFPLPVQWP